MSRRSERFQKYDVDTRVGMLEDDIDEITADTISKFAALEARSARRFRVAASIATMFGTAMLAGITELVVTVLRGGK